MTTTLPDDPIALAQLLVEATDALRTANLDALTEDQLVTVAETTEQARRVADAARTLAPDQLKKVGIRLLAHLDPDGQLTDERDRRRHRELTLAQQDLRLMSKLTAHLTPQVRAKLEVILHAWAAPGFNNPDDPDTLHGAADAPGIDSAARQAAADRDHRSPGQRNHDALEALLDFVLTHGALGAPGKLSASLVITADLTDLAASTGIALTATGTRLPVPALLDLAADTVPYLEVFAGATREILYLGRGRRLASKAQRLALFGRDRGCTGPGCDQPFARTEAHHMPDWQHGGPTDIDHLGAACGPHNRAASTGPARWNTTILGAEAGHHAGRVGWTPTDRDTTPTVNPIHHADLPLRRPPPAAHPPSARTSAAEYRLLGLLAARPATPVGDTDLRLPPAA